MPDIGNIAPPTENGPISRALMHKPGWVIWIALTLGFWMFESAVCCQVRFSVSSVAV